MGPKPVDSDALETPDPFRVALDAITKGDWAVALHSSDAALAQARTPAARGDILLLRAVARQASGDSSGAAEDATTAVTSWSQSGVAVIGGHLVALARALAGSGERAPALRFLAAAVEVIVASGGEGGAVAVDLGVIAAGLGAEALARRAWECATQTASSAAAMAHVNLARLELDAGRASAALDHAEAALRAGPGVHLDPAAGVALDICADLEATGNLDGVAAVLARLDAATPGFTGDRSWRGVLAALEYDRGMTALQADNLDAAAEHLAAAAAAATAPDLMVSTLTTLAGIDLRCGRTMTALARAGAAADHARDDDDRLDVAGVLVEVGETAAGRAEWALVSDAFTQAAALYETAGRRELARAFTAAATAGKVR